jgi:hypothetical protein
MAITPGDPTTSAIELARSLRPQGFGPRSVKKIADPVVEPQWVGIRVIASAQDRAAALFEDGEAVPHDEVSRALGTMLWRTTESAILDGYLTKQAHPQEAPVATGLEEVGDLDLAGEPEQLVFAVEERQLAAVAGCELPDGERRLRGRAHSSLTAISGSITSHR